MPPLDELEIGDVLIAHTDFGRVAAGRERFAFPPPQHHAQIAPRVDLLEGREELTIHFVVGRVVLLGPVVGQDGDAVLDLELHQLITHDIPFDPPRCTLRLGSPALLGPSGEAIMASPITRPLESWRLAGRRDGGS